MSPTNSASHLPAAEAGAQGSRLKTWQYIFQLIRFRPWLYLALGVLETLFFGVFPQIVGWITYSFFNTLTGDAPPTVVLRGHLHPRKGIYDTGWTYPVRAVICPSWKLVDEHGSKRTPGAVNVVGAVFFRVTGARIDLWPVTYFPKRQKAWTETT